MAEWLEPGEAFCQYCGRAGAAQALKRGGLACGPCVNEIPGLRQQLVRNPEHAAGCGPLVCNCKEGA